MFQRLSVETPRSKMGPTEVFVFQERSQSPSPAPRNPQVNEGNMDDNSQNDLGLQTGKLRCLSQGGPLGGLDEEPEMWLLAAAQPPTPVTLSKSLPSLGFFNLKDWEKWGSDHSAGVSGGFWL